LGKIVRSYRLIHSKITGTRDFRRVYLEREFLPETSLRIEISDPTSSDAKWCLEQYFSELDKRFEGGFDPSQSISANARELILPAGVMLVAYLSNEPVGCGALKFHNDGIAELKRMWVSPNVRGRGVGKKLLQALEDSARKAGAKVIHLETNKSLVEAKELYRRAGYQEVEPFNSEPYANHWFEKKL
jgi:ribosomal protein S18 acetylase RimI-like enzyme